MTEDTRMLSDEALDALLDTDKTPPRLPATLRMRLIAAAPQPGVAPTGDSLTLARNGMARAGRGRNWARAAALGLTLAGGAAAGFAGGAAALPTATPEQTLLDMALSAPFDPLAAFAEDDA